MHGEDLRDNGGKGKQIASTTTLCPLCANSGCDTMTKALLSNAYIHDSKTVMSRAMLDAPTPSQ
jgi:hypothetical protein